MSEHTDTTTISVDEAWLREWAAEGIAALERLVGRQALELAFLKGLSKTARGREAGLCP